MYRMCCGWQGSPLHGGPLVAPVVPQHNLPRVRAPHHNVGVELGKGSRHDSRLSIEEDKQRKGEAMFSFSSGEKVCVYSETIRQNVPSCHIQSEKKERVQARVHVHLQRPSLVPDSTMQNLCGRTGRHGFVFFKIFSHIKDRSWYLHSGTTSWAPAR